MVTGWQKIDGSWYYFGAGGSMQTGWQKIGGKWYYMNESGVMQTGWKKISGRWYYFEGSGAMAANKWVGNYYLTGSGAMATNTWDIKRRTKQGHRSYNCCKIAQYLPFLDQGCAIPVTALLFSRC